MGLNSNIKMINSTACHCCSFDVFRNIIEDKSLRLCDMRNTNDPKEVIAASEYILKHINLEYKKTKNEKYLILKDIYIEKLKDFNPHVISFTNIVNKTIFDRYAKHGEGIGINFHSSSFGIGIYIINDDKEIYYVPVFYEIEGCRKLIVPLIKLYLDGEIDVDKAVLELMKISCMYKTKEWEDEKEIRIYYVPSSKKLLGEKRYFTKHDKTRSYYKLPFDKFDKEEIIESIILGPNFNKNNYESIRELLKKNKLDYVKVYTYEESYIESLNKIKTLGY